MEKKCKKAKWLSGEALQIAVNRREVKSKGEKERYTCLNEELQRIVRGEKKAFLSDQCKEIEENNRMGKTRDLFKEIRESKAKMGTIKDRMISVHFQGKPFNITVIQVYALKERYKHLNAEFQRIARRDKKAFFRDQCKEIEEKNRMGKTRDLFKKIRDTKGTFHAKMGSIFHANHLSCKDRLSKGQKW